MGAKRVAARLALSFAGGVLIPFLYIVILIAHLSTRTQNPRARFLLDLPVGWPRYIYFYAFISFGRHPADVNEGTLLAFAILCNVLLYSFVTYFALGMFPAFRRRKAEYGTPPPPYVGGAD